MNIKKMVFASLLIALGTTASHLIVIPVGVAKCYPLQHAINVIGAVLLGPAYAVGNALLISILRNMLGVGSILAFPGSMIGALLAGLAFKVSGKKILAALGEVLGTGLIGGAIAFPMAQLFLGADVAGWFFIPPFAISSIGGALVGLAVLSALEKRPGQVLSNS